jgi:predicted nucleic acid-binding protein
VITAIDTNVLLDVLSADPEHGRSSRAALEGSLDAGAVVVCDVALAETVAAFPDPEVGLQAIGALGVGYSATTEKTAAAAGACWQAYRAAGGSRARIIADFLVGVHAMTQADRLLTRDRGFFRHYFDGLTVVDPKG